MVNTDKDWETFARQDAYFSVLTREEFVGTADNPESKARFFMSGEQHVDRVLGRLRMTSGSPPADWDVLDFGCGVGRVLLPLARRCRRAVGVDVSATMMAETRRNLSASGFNNAEVCALEDIPPDNRFDLIHSFIVFQHIPTSKGMDLIGRLLDLLKPGGRIALHFTYARDYGHNRLGWRLASRFSYLIPVLRLLKLENPFRRRMLMMRYELNDVLQLLWRRGISSVVIDTTSDDGNLGAMVYGSSDGP